LKKDMAKNPKFDLEEQYRLYLLRMSLRETEMHPQQRLQLKQTFYGSAGQMLIMLRDDVSALPEEQAVAALDDLIQQVVNYFQNQN
jgi:hypothetical protein